MSGFRNCKVFWNHSEEVARQAKKLGIQKLGFEEDYLTYSTFKSYEKK